MIVAFIDEVRAEFGVEPVCTVLQVAPSTYYAAKRRQLHPSARAVRDAMVGQMLMALWVANRKVYGAHKLWKAARRAGHDIGRDQVARLMRQLGIEGVKRRRKVFTTRPDPDAVRAADLVNRVFTVDRPNALWVTDLTYVPTRSGMAYVCFIVDAFSRRIVGWRVAAHMRTDMVLDALEMARATRGARRLVGLVAHSDAGSQGNTCRFGTRSGLPRTTSSPRSGRRVTATTVALAESFNGLYKWELIYRHGPRRGLDDVEFETMSYIDWFNHRRLHGEITDDASYTTPAEFEALYYRQAAPALEAVTQ